MSGENAAPAPEPSAPQAPTSELQPGAPAPADGGATPANVDANAPEQQQTPPAETPEEQDKKRQRFDRRFSDLSKAAREAELRAARLEGELNALRNSQRQPEPQAQPAPVAPAAPDPKSYPGGKFDDKYIEDFAAWKAERAVEAALEKRDADAKERQRAEAANAAIQEGRQRLEQTLSAAIAEADSEQGEHFQNAPRVLDLAFFPVREGGLPRYVVDLITESDNPVHVAEVLGRQPDRLAAVRQMTPIQAAKYLGALDAQIGANLKRLAAKPAPARPAPQASPAPVPVVPSGGAAPSFDPNKGSMEDFVRWRNGG